MKCADCKFFSPHIEHECFGTCTFTFPPQLQEPANNFASSTRTDNGCDLGQPKDADSKAVD
jgi:hypothetical protein